MSFINWVHREGLSNFGQDKDVVFTANEFAIVKYKYVAHCTSYACTGHHDYGTVVKEVGKGVVDCLDCGSALFFEKVKVE
jgi:hypothetical protein